MSVPSVELRTVSKRFGVQTAVDGISLAVQPGEFLTLLGPSGCGKTTTLRMVAGFERPSHGEVVIAGQPVTGLPPNRRNVHTVFQNYALFPHMTVGDNVGFGLRMRRLPRAEIASQVREALEMVQLAGLERRRPSQLSGGQQQRVALARALVNRPAVLLLDEPLGALDLKLRRAMQGELRRLNRSVGITFMYVTHDQEEALTMSDRIAVMNGGRILQLGTAQEIYEAPATRFVADFIGESNFLEGTPAGVSGDLTTIRLRDGVALRARHGVVAPVDGVATLTVRPERITIEPESGPERAGTDNVLSGRVAQAVYAGATLQYLVQVGDGTTMVVRTPNLGSPLEPGAAVTLRWSPYGCSLLAG